MFEEVIEDNYFNTGSKKATEDKHLTAYPKELYVYKKLVHVCPFCDSELVQAVKQNKKGKYVFLGLTTCDKCKKSFANAAYYSENREYFTCMNMKHAEALVNARNAKIEYKRHRFDTWGLGKGTHDLKHDRNAEFEKEQRLKNRILEKIPAYWSNEYGLNIEALSNSWQKVNVSSSGLNSIFAIFLVRNGAGKLHCFFLSNDSSECKIPGNHASIVYVNGKTGFWLVKSIKAKKTYFTSQNNSRYNVIDAVVTYEPYFNEYVGKVNVKSLYKRHTSAIVNAVSKETINYSNNKCVYVYFRLTNTCVKNKHNVETVTAKTYNAKNGNPIEVNVFHCTQCDRYFINYEALQVYISKGIFPAFSYSLIRDISGELNEASQLMLYGYNVREGVLSGDERKNILSWVIDSGLMSKAEIIKDLQFKVKYNGSKARNERARDKWQDDIQFVSKYVIDNKKEIKATFIPH